MKQPKLRFPEFTGDWKQHKFEDIVTIGSGKDYKHLESGNVPVYGTGGYMLSVNQALSESEDAVGIGRKGTIDKPYILRAPFWTVDTLFYCIPNKGFDLTFTNCLFQNVDWKKKDESTGVPSLSKVIINNVKTYVPSLEEQQKIASLFSELDTLIQSAEKELEGYRELKQGMLQKMFPKRNEVTPEIRFLEFDGNWEQCKLGDIGKTYTSLSGKTADDFGHGEANFITYMNVYSNSIADPTMVAPIEIDVKQHEVEVGDVFFTTSSETPDEVGMSCVLKEKQGIVYLNSFCFGFRPTKSFDLNFLAYMLRSNYVRNQIKILAQGVSRYNISKTKMMDVSIIFPDYEEQKKIGECFSNLDNLINLQQKEIDRYKELKKGLLQQMFC